MRDDVIYFVHQNAFAEHFFDHARGHFALAETLDVGLARVVAHFFFYFGQVVTFFYLNFDEAVSGAFLV